MKTSYRTHTCNALNASNENEQVTLSGWVHSRRDHGGIIFIDLRDKYGLTQIVFDPEFEQSVFQTAEKLRREDVIKVTGTVKKRAQDLINPKLQTGEIEVFIKEISVINKSETPPFEIEDNAELNDDIRLQFRYLDLRRPVMQKHLKIRHQAMKATREYFDQNEFTEILTPLLIKSTPEGARDYVVPSRVNKGQFYALPQSPQIYKQLLMISGCDRYYQLPVCLRDEDLRSDRQPEHQQIDFEMSFVSQEDIRTFTEGLFANIVEKTTGKTVETPFPVIPFDESMEKYSIDKPDIRFELFTYNVSDIVAKSEFSVFKNVVNGGGMVKCINPPKDFSRTEFDNYIAYSQKLGSKGMAWMRVTENGLDGNIVKYFPESIQKELIEKTGAKPGTSLMFIADKPTSCCDIIAKLRLKVGEDLQLIDHNKLAFCWINDFPLFEWNEDEKKWDAMHNMFCMPKEEWIDKLESQTKDVKGDLYDLVLNGWELGSGAIRVSNPELQKRIMNIIGITTEEAEKKFGFLLEAYKYGGPIHAGMGLGFDRIVALLVGTHDIREVIAFPKNKNAQCPMDGSPANIEEVQLKELALKIDIPKKE